MNIIEAVSTFKVENQHDVLTGLAVITDILLVIERATEVKPGDIYTKLEQARRANVKSEEINKELDNGMAIKIDTVSDNIIFVDLDTKEMVALSIADNTLIPFADKEISDDIEKKIYDTYDTIEDKIISFYEDLKNIKVEVA